MDGCPFYAGKQVGKQVGLIDLVFKIVIILASWQMIAAVVVSLRWASSLCAGDIYEVVYWTVDHDYKRGSNGCQESRLNAFCLRC